MPKRLKNVSICSVIASFGPFFGHMGKSCCYAHLPEPVPCGIFIKVPDCLLKTKNAPFDGAFLSVVHAAVK